MMLMERRESFTVDIGQLDPCLLRANFCHSAGRGSACLSLLQHRSYLSTTTRQTFPSMLSGGPGQHTAPNNFRTVNPHSEPLHENGCSLQVDQQPRLSFRSSTLGVSVTPSFKLTASPGEVVNQRGWWRGRCHRPVAGSGHHERGREQRWRCLHRVQIDRRPFSPPSF